MFVMCSGMWLFHGEQRRLESYQLVRIQESGFYICQSLAAKSGQVFLRGSKRAECEGDVWCSTVRSTVLKALHHG